MESFLCVAFDPFACVECGSRFSTKNAEFTPAGLSCGHTLCATCADACTLVIPPICTVCKVVVSADVVPNTILGTFCDETLCDSTFAAELGLTYDSEAEGSARGGKRAKVGSNNSPPAVVYCTVHPSEPAEKYCPNHNMALCTGCKPDHCDCYHKIDFDSAGWLCCWKPEKFRAFAHAAGITATQTEALKKKSQDNCDEAVSEVVNSFAELKAKLDDLCTAKVAEIRKLCSERLKQLDVMHDELLVRVSQLNAAAALCESVKDKAPAVTVPLLVSLKPFDQLANATITAGEHMTCVNFRGELPAMVQSIMDSLSFCLEVRSVDEHNTTAEEADATLQSIFDKPVEVLTKERIVEVLSVMDDHVLNAAVQAQACSVLHSIVGKSDTVAATVVSCGAVVRIIRAMRTHLADNAMQWPAVDALKRLVKRCKPLLSPWAGDIAATVLQSLVAMYIFEQDLQDDCVKIIEQLQDFPGFAEAMIAYRGEAFLRDYMRGWGETVLEKIFAACPGGLKGDGGDGEA